MKKPGWGGGGASHMKGWDVRWKFSLNFLQEANHGVARDFLDPERDNILSI